MNKTSQDSFCTAWMENWGYVLYMSKLDHMNSFSSQKYGSSDQHLYT